MSDHYRPILRAAGDRHLERTPRCDGEPRYGFQGSPVEQVTEQHIDDLIHDGFLEVEYGSVLLTSAGERRLDGGLL